MINIELDYLSFFISTQGVDQIGIYLIVSMKHNMVHCCDAVADKIYWITMDFVSHDRLKIK